MLRKVVQRNIEFSGVEFHAHQEGARIHVTMLVGVQDIAAVLKNESGNAGDYAFPVRATEQEDGAFSFHLQSVHRRAFKSFRISRAAFAPDPPVSPVPGWVPDPQR